jgi:hypothetical protein
MIDWMQITKGWRVVMRSGMRAMEKVMAEDIVNKLRGWCTDWNGSQMVRGEPPRDGLHCDDLLDAADEIERLRKENQELETQLDTIGYDRKERT